MKQEQRERMKGGGGKEEREREDGVNGVNRIEE